MIHGSIGRWSAIHCCISGDRFRLRATRELGLGAAGRESQSVLRRRRLKPACCVFSVGFARGWWIRVLPLPFASPHSAQARPAPFTPTATSFPLQFHGSIESHLLSKLPPYTVTSFFSIPLHTPAGFLSLTCNFTDPLNHFLLPPSSYRHQFPLFNSPLRKSTKPHFLSKP